MITRTQRLCLSTNLFINSHSCKQYFSQQSRQTYKKLYFNYLVAKSFYWPSLLHYQSLPKPVMEIGVLQQRITSYRKIPVFRKPCSLGIEGGFARMTRGEDAKICSMGRCPKKYAATLQKGCST
jgi:hypothetical protein